ncbi:hypothetical protein, variant 2 [Batrachochytrium dendrobatidis JEL423]|nr:hypothetical protein, variant 1 [Batrachochytrium dendrobatidis JEL423]OAJ41652.1 hypothetical protein, variant 2 [Batrachochytrium dendrobatidis JEL423]
MTMGNDMSALFPDVMACIGMPQLEVKKMVYLYLITYAKSKPDLTVSAIGSLTRDTGDDNPLIRALALRTMGSIPVEGVAENLCGPLRRCLSDKDPYVCKTAAICVAKMFFFREDIVRREGFIDLVKSLLNHENPSVVANAVAALSDMTCRSPDVGFYLEIGSANKILSAIEECSEWGQTYILEALMTVVPENSHDAVLLADRISPRLQHSNSAVVVAAARVMLYLVNYCDNEVAVNTIIKKLGPPLVTLLHSTPEVQYVALKNILLILQRQPDFLKADLKVFFCKYDDPIYIKLVKLEILFCLTDEVNIKIVLPEFKEYAAEIDVDFVRKAVRSIGRCAIKIEQSSDKCIEALVELITTKVNYVVQEAIVVVKDIFRKYPNRYESIIGTLCENLDDLNEPEAKSSMIWIIGQYSDRIENADELLEQFLDNFKEDTSMVQLTLLTATVKLFIKRPGAGVDLVPRILKLVTEEIDNPDLRDRGFIYWRLLSTDPVAAKAIIFSEKPSITTENDSMDGPLLNRLLYNVFTLSSLTHKPPVLPPDILSRVSNFKWCIGTPMQPVQPMIAGVAAYREVSNEYTDNSLIEARPMTGMNSNLIDLLDLDQNDFVASPLFGNAYSVESASASTPGPNMLSSGMTDMPIMNRLPAENITPSIQSINSSYNPFGPMPPNKNPVLSGASGILGPSVSGATAEYMPNVTSFDLSSVNSYNPFGQNTSASLSTTSEKVLLDPFAKTSGFSGATGVNNTFTSPSIGQSTIEKEISPRGNLFNPPTNGIVDSITQDLFSLNMQNGFVPVKTIFLTAQTGRGFEIQGCFTRLDGVMACEMVFTNRALQPLTDFAIMFNKNSFGLVPAAPLDIKTQLFPNQSIEVSLKLKVEGLPVLSTPVNNLQVAVKSTAGIVYFQTLVPLYIFFSDQGSQIQPMTWVKLWKEEIPNQVQFDLTLGQFGSSANIRARLQGSNIFTINERIVDGCTHMYLSIKMDDQTIFLVEMRLSSTLLSCSCTAKTYAAHLLGAFQFSLQDILSK